MITAACARVALSFGANILSPTPFMTPIDEEMTPQALHSRKYRYHPQIPYAADS